MEHCKNCGFPTDHLCGCSSCRVCLDFCQDKCHCRWKQTKLEMKKNGELDVEYWCETHQKECD